MVTPLIAVAALAASLPGTYECTIAHQAVIDENGVHPDRQPVTFSGTEADAWRFRVRVPRGETPEVAIEWPANPIQVAGRHAALPLAPGQIALAAVSPGPCMFTEDACVSLVEFSAREDGSLAFSILPAGSARQQSGARSILHVVFVGACRRLSGAS